MQNDILYYSLKIVGTLLIFSAILLSEYWIFC
jgi:hypothetical protein